MGKFLIYTAIFGGDEQLREPLADIPDCELICITDRDDLKSDNWKIIHQKDIPGFFTFRELGNGKRHLYTKPRMKARLVKTVFPVRIQPFNITNFFDKFEGQVYIWIDGSMQLRRDPFPLIETYMKGADILSFKHPDRSKIEEEAKAASGCRGANLEKGLLQVATYRARGFTSAVQEAITVTGFFFRRHIVKMNFFNLSWIQEILLHTERDQLSVDYCIWKHSMRRNFILSKRAHRGNRWVSYFPHRKETNNG